MKNKSLTPEIRFKGYDDEWTESVISEHFNLYSGTTPSRSIPDAFNGDVNWISSGELKLHYIGETKEKLSEDVFLKSSLRLLPPNLLVIAIYGLEAAGVRGTASITSVPTTISQACTAFIPKSIGEIGTEFLYGWYKHNGNYIGTHFAQGTKQQNLKSEIINELSVCYPKEDEQKQIGNLLRNLDKLIDDVDREISRLEKIKQASLQKMFPRHGETTPEIRFKGFAEPWHYQKAGVNFKMINERNRPDLPVLSAFQDLRGMTPRDESGYSISHDKANEVTYKVIYPGNFVIHLRSFQGGFAHSTYHGITSPAYTVFEISDCSKHDDYFWKIVFMSHDFIESLKTITYGIRDGRSISFDEFSSLKLCFPSKEEQQKISEYFRRINNLLLDKRKKLIKFQNLKQSCIDKMFINTTAQ